jgi:hypothetical protein
MPKKDWTDKRNSYLLFMKQLTIDTQPINANNTSMVISKILTYGVIWLSVMATIVRAPIIDPTA